MAFVRFPASKLRWSVQPETFASSNVVERAFCKACGTPLTYRLVNSANIGVTLNSLDDPSAAPVPDVSASTEQRASWLTALDGMQHEDCDMTTDSDFTNNQGAGAGIGRQ